MKKEILAIVLLNFVLLMQAPISAQTLNANINPRIKDTSSVKYSSLKAFSDGNGVLLEWETEFENANMGFYIYRGVGEQRQLVNTSLIPGRYLRMRGGSDSGNSYSFFDRQGDLTSTYSIESLNAGGQKNDTGLITTQYRNDLNDIASDFSNSNQESENVNSNIYSKELILSKALQSEIGQNSLQADTSIQSWVAAQPGVKIGVKTQGIYRVTRAQMEANGFNVNASTALWQLYANGVEQAITVGDNGTYIEFYGKGIDTRDSNTQIYFLVVGTQNGKRILPPIRRSVKAGVVANNYLRAFTFKERTNYSSAVFNGETENFFGRIFNNAGTTIPLNLTGVDFGATTSSIDITVQGSTTVAHQIRVMLNGVELGFLSGSGRSSMTSRFEFPTSVLIEGANNLQLTSSATNDFSYFDTVKVNYARKYQAEQNSLSFSLPFYKSAYLRGFSSANIRVFDVTVPDSPKIVTNMAIRPDGSGFQVYLPSNTGRVFYAIEDSAILQPSSITANAPSTLSNTAHNAELVIISHKNFMTEAEEWGAYRRSQGLTVEVVNIEDVFDEFSFGIYDSEAAKSFLKYAKNNWQTPVKYALLIGDAHYDTRNYIASGVRNLLPTKMVETVYLETGSDDYLVDFNNDGLAEIAIGRIPAETALHVTTALNKTKNFEQTVEQNFARGFLFVSDDPIGYDFVGINSRLRALLPSEVPRTMIKRSDGDAPTVTALLKNEMNLGRYVVNFSGHGTQSAWTSGNIFNNTIANQLTNADKLTVFSMLTCLNGYFIGTFDSLAETLVRNPNGGAVAAWASSGETTADIQEVMATRFFQQLSLGNIKRLGDLVNDAKTSINAGRDVRLSWVLISDPTLKMR
ncbi:MAG: C25 family cysteine peptidase [Acidobacteriota bacterium]|nr:C25 family cysteine peptidase [Acidobacteriota bacterium]